MNLNNLRKHGTSKIASLLCLVSTLGMTQSNHHGGATADGSSRQTAAIPFEELKWQAIVPELGAESPQISILHVAAETGATQLMIRTSKSMHVPLHWHSANETHTMIQGTAVFEHEGQRTRLGPGGFNYMPAKMQHQAWTSDGALIFITVDGPWDVNWVSNPPGKSDLGLRPPPTRGK